MRVALAHDYLTQCGGAERVALHLTRMFPGAPLYTSVYDSRGTYDGFAHVDLRTTWLQGLAPVRHDPRLTLPLLPLVWSRVRIEAADVVLASSSGWSHAVQVGEGCRKVVYCHNPARWVYQPEDYAEHGWSRTALRGLRPALSAWDKAAAATADRYVANSSVVAQRVRDAYRVEPVVIHPPVTIDTSGDQQPVAGIDPGYWLTIARSRGYKNTQAVVDGTRDLPQNRLVVVGPAGPHRDGGHVRAVGVVTDAQLRWLYANARALVSVSHEDFGLTPLEANAFGTPAAVLRAGGFLDSTLEGVSGQFIEAPTAAAVRDCLISFPDFDVDKVVAHAARFSTEEFERQLRTTIAEVMS